MKKLKLDLESIQVLSFTSDTEPRRGGTVRAYASYTHIVYDTCGGWHGCLDMHASRDYPC